METETADDIFSFGLKSLEETPIDIIEGTICVLSIRLFTI